MADLISPAEHVYNINDWESTYDADDVYSPLTDHMAPGEIMEVGRLKRLPSVYAACVLVGDDHEVRLYATRNEAAAAAKDANR